MDHQAVIDEILRRAESPDIDAIEETLAPLRETLSDLKERGVSLLTAASAYSPDPYLDRKLKQIENLVIADRIAIAQTLIPDGGWSRDSLAVTKGNRLAPHQSLIALCLSATVLENGLSALMKAVRESALHLERIAKEQRKMPTTARTVFLGHGRSPVWRELKEFLGERLHLAVDEFNSVSMAGIPTATRLEEILDSASFAFLIMTAEDEQPDGTFNARLNVVHEAGLFQGRHGFRRAIILLEDTCEEFSNVHGLGQIRFPKGNISAKFEAIRIVLEREGLFGSDPAAQEINIRQPESVAVLGRGPSQRTENTASQQPQLNAINLPVPGGLRGELLSDDPLYERVDHSQETGVFQRSIHLAVVNGTNDDLADCSLRLIASTPPPMIGDFKAPYPIYFTDRFDLSAGKRRFVKILSFVETGARSEVDRNNIFLSAVSGGWFGGWTLLSPLPSRDSPAILTLEAFSPVASTTIRLEVWIEDAYGKRLRARIME
jgi:predicted nucleotide-binding protein